MSDVKYVCVIVDDFTSLSLSFPNVTLVDYGSYCVEQVFDHWYYDYWTSVDPVDYGDIDSVEVVSDTRDYYLVDSYFQSTLTDLQRIGPYLDSYNAFYNLYMYEGYTDIGTFESLTAFEPNNTLVGHGDWVLESFFQQIDDPSAVEVVAIDIDFTTFEDFSYLFSRQGDYSVLELATDLAFQSFYEADNEYLLAGLSASWGGMVVDEAVISAVDDLLSYGSFVVQAVANVTQESIPWGEIEANVINVGAYNVDQNGYILASDESGYPALDILANGYVEKDLWGEGWKFGTSFATPRVFAEIVNLFDEYLSPDILSGAVDVTPISESDPITDLQLKSFVDATLEWLTTEVEVKFSGIQEPVLVPVMSDDITSSLNPVVVPVSLNNSGLIFSSASLPDTDPPYVETVSPTDGAAQVPVDSDITLTFNEAVQRGAGIIEIRLGSVTGTAVESFDAANSNRLTFSDATLTIDPSSELTGNTQYYVTLSSGSVRDLAGNDYPGLST